MNESIWIVIQSYAPYIRICRFKCAEPGASTMPSTDLESDCVSRRAYSKHVRPHFEGSVTKLNIITFVSKALALHV